MVSLPKIAAAMTLPWALAEQVSDPPVTNIWQWRSDMDMGKQLSFDLSGDYTGHGFYGACWRDPNSETLADESDYGTRTAAAQWQDKANPNITYGSYDWDTGVTLYNKKSPSGKKGCVMRKSRLPIDLSVIGRIEFDVYSSGGGGVAPWYSVWLTPMLYAGTDDSAKAAEIDLIENYDVSKQGVDMNRVNSNFATCGGDGDFAYTKPFCKDSVWGALATSLNHHVTLKAIEDPNEGRIIRVYRCPLPATTCSTGDYSEIKVTKMPPPAGVVRDDWFPVWNKAKAGPHYGRYWLVADMWWTSGTDFKLAVEKIQFFMDNGAEWKMPLEGPPPTAAAETPAEVVVV